MRQENPIRELIVPPERRGERLDRWLAAECPEISRARIQELIEEGLIRVNGGLAKAALKLRGGETVQIEARERPALRAEAEQIPLDVLYEDEDLLVVNKPAGMSVHAGAGSDRGTLVNALLGRGQGLSKGSVSAEDDEEGQSLRPGIVHRLDKETSGAIIVAKNDFAHAKLAEAFQARGVQKVYLALVEGKLEGESGRIALPIGRDPGHRTRMKAWPPPKGVRTLPAGKVREALTEWRRLLVLGESTLAEVRLHTGRTHQIRVHFAAVRHPIAGDKLYGAHATLKAGKLTLAAPSRQFLHAARLSFPHPRDGRQVEVLAPLAQDLQSYLERLRLVARADAAAYAQYL